MFRKIIRKLLRILAKKEIKERQLALGISSYISIDKDVHIVMLDYDILDLKYVLEDIKDLIHHFYLSDYEIYRTSKGFHVFFWYDRVPYSRLKMIIDYSRCDKTYKYISRFYDYKVLRSTGKYKQQDIFFVGRYSGKRLMTRDERELGNLKRKEYIELKKIKFKEEWLK